jgi:hypothetical protein
MPMTAFGLTVLLRKYFDVNPDTRSRVFLFRLCSRRHGLLLRVVSSKSALPKHPSCLIISKTIKLDYGQSAFDSRCVFPFFLYAFSKYFPMNI